jgi:hypothetical protein
MPEVSIVGIDVAKQFSSSMEHLPMDRLFFARRSRRRGFSTFFHSSRALWSLWKHVPRPMGGVGRSPASAMRGR